jgi:hypothetical protein
MNWGLVYSASSATWPELVSPIPNDTLERWVRPFCCYSASEVNGSQESCQTATSAGIIWRVVVIEIVVIELGTQQPSFYIISAM